MSRTHTRLAIAALALTLAAQPAAAAAGDDKKTSQTSERTRDRAEARDEDRRDVGDTLGDAWLVTKVKAQFWDEDALDNSDINVDARDGVIILRGTVASQAGKARAVQVARDTEGVKRVEDRLTVGRASRDDGDDADEAGTTARDAKREAKDAARGSREAVGTAGEAVTDGWITTKVKGSFVGEDALDNSDIDVDTTNGVVTLTGTVASEAGRARAVAVAKKIDGVKSVKDELKIKRDE